MTDFKILIVEDEMGVRNALASLLKNRGYDVLESSSGADAISIVESKKPDAILLDIQLADNIDGMEVLEKVKTISSKIEVIMLSASPEEHCDKAKELGAYCFLRKPITKIHLLFNAIDEISKKTRD